MIYILICLLQGPCRGNSGGSLYVDHGKANQKKITLEGIVAFGVGKCGGNFPQWYTSVSSHRDWIDCIISGIKNKATKVEVEQQCNKKVQDFPSTKLFFNTAKDKSDVGIETCL